MTRAHDAGLPISVAAADRSVVRLVGKSTVRTNAMRAQCCQRGRTRRMTVWMRIAGPAGEVEHHRGGLYPLGPIPVHADRVGDEPSERVGLIEVSTTKQPRPRRPVATMSAAAWHRASSLASHSRAPADASEVGGEILVIGRGADVAASGMTWRRGQVVPGVVVSDVGRSTWATAQDVIHREHRSGGGPLSLQSGI